MDAGASAPDLLDRKDIMWYKRIEVTDSCWNWLGSVANKGYGNIQRTIEGRRNRTQAHRYVYEKLVGEIPEGMLLHHTCHNKRCVRPSHLEPMTYSDHSKMHHPTGRRRSP